MDVHVPYAICVELRLRSVRILTAQEDGAGELDDAALLDPSSELHHVLFSRDGDLLKEAARRQRLGVSFVGLIFAHQRLVSIGQCVAELEFIAKVSETAEWASRVEYLPLR